LGFAPAGHRAVPTATLPLVTISSQVSRERIALLVVWDLAVLGSVLELLAPASGAPHPTLPQQALDLVRVLTCVALVIVLVLGPGLVLRSGRGRNHWSLGFVALPGLALLGVTGCAAWGLGLVGWVHPRVVSYCALGPVLAWLLVALVRAQDDFLTSAERRALFLVGAALCIAIGRSIWSLGPSGELYGGTISRTLEVGDRSDPVISFHVVQMVAQGLSATNPLARSYFLPYNFSARGPLAGFASAPIVLMSGGHPPANLLPVAWIPFDPQGYMSYRLAMMTFACTAFLSLWTLARTVAGERVARFSLLLAVTTPFLVHEIWFTWPKLLAASLVLLAAERVLRGRYLEAGLLIGLGYLVHPLALLSLPVLVLLALWPLKGAQLRRPRLGAAGLVVTGTAVWLVVWRLVNWSHYTQSNFINYVEQMGRSKAWLAGHPGPFNLSAWLADRLVSLGNTVVPLRLFFLSANDQSINTANQPCFPLCNGGSPGVVHFFFQYWTGIPFGFAIVFFPFLIVGLWRAAQRFPWAVTATIIIPFFLFVIYWGDASTGLLREGLHVWVLTVIIVLAVEQGQRSFPWLRTRLGRAVLALRALEVVLVAVVPTVATRDAGVQHGFVLTDIVAWALILAPAGWLAASIWYERIESSGGNAGERLRNEKSAAVTAVA
jgi:hypothetical protein